MVASRGHDKDSNSELVSYQFAYLNQLLCTLRRVSISIQTDAFEDGSRL